MSVYSTPLPLVSVSDDASTFSDDSNYFTPEASFSTWTPQKSSLSSSISRPRSKSVSDVRNVSPVSPLIFNNPLGIPLNNINFHVKEWNPVFDKENHYCYSTPVKKSIAFTPRSYKTAPLKCISNIVTPIQVKSNMLLFDEKENKLKPSFNNSFETTSSVYKNNLLSSKSKYCSKSGSKNKSTFLQRLGIRRKSKIEYDRFIEEDSVSPTSGLSSGCMDDSDTLPVIHRTESRRSSQPEIDVNGECDVSTRYATNNLKIVHESVSSLLLQKDLTKRKTKIVWQNLYHYPKVLAFKDNIFLPCVARDVKAEALKNFLCQLEDEVRNLESQKLSVYPLRNLFTRKPLNDKPANTEFASSFHKNPCSCSAVALSNQELLGKILLKLSSLEEQIGDLKFSLQNNGSGEKTSFSCLPPPPPPPLPPPLPNLLSSSADLKRKIMTPHNGPVTKRQEPMKTQFAITVEDIKSVKLRKTPSTMKRLFSGTPQTPSIKDGVLRSVKFKPVKRTVTQKKELSNLVAEILSPSSKTDQGERNCVINAKLFENKENLNISNNFEVTPVKCKNKNVKFRSTKRRESSLDSPTRKRLNTAHKTLVFCDSGGASCD